ncbi:hypothetical protein L2E82_24504 [Cichorium intybus]|uniref:Uncharacterized protein n=1 Tax=Cichorium intybus TaxID=13427 RepID=A0ACB9E202_CICIN|nr:hypothetical protein L2E82_24504 [Cichorium intybus]
MTSGRLKLYTAILIACSYSSQNMNEAFQIGKEIASAVTKINRNPVVLKMEKVYQLCFPFTKKSYEKPDQVKPVFDAWINDFFK